MIDYQAWARAMWNWQSPGDKLLKLTQRDDFIIATGLGGETGEVLEILKKHVRSRKPDSQIDIKHLTEELGDVLYMVSMIASRWDISLDQIIKFNMEKLEKRKVTKLALKAMVRRIKKAKKTAKKAKRKW